MKRILGINDDKDDCCCCGKTGLKKVVWIEDTETLTIEHYGTTCASCIMYGNRRPQNVKTVVNVAQNEERRCRSTVALAATHARETKALSARFCRERNKTRKDSEWSLYQGDITTLRSEHGFYTVPADCTEKVEYLKRNGWEVC